MNSGTLEPQYFQRMNSALEDKLAALDPIAHLITPDTRVADMGAGSGALAQAIADRFGATVYAFDNNPHAVARMQGLSVEVVEGSFADLSRYEPFDIVLCSSVLHEVYSYGGDNEVDRADAWIEAVSHALKALTPQGHLVIRDGVAANNMYASATLHAHTDEDYALLKRYAAKMVSVDQRRMLTLRDEHKDALGTVLAVSEALLTLNWISATDTDEVQFERESYERYALSSHGYYSEEVQNLAQHMGMNLREVFHSVYTQPGYIEHLSERFSMFQSGTLHFPPTNMTLIFTKM